MRKLSLLLILLLLFLAGCSNGKSTETISGDKDPNKVVTTDTPKTSGDEAKPKGYVFESGKVSIAMNAKVAPILKDLGNAKEYFEAESCAFQGMDKTYTYNGFELHTYELDKVDYVVSVIFTDDSVSTKEGISLNADLSEVLKTYGDKYTQKSNLYTFEQDKSKLSFLIENNKVTSIEYTAITE